VDTVSRQLYCVTGTSKIGTSHPAQTLGVTLPDQKASVENKN
jgi:hypothetical protein